jgi:hypothetical protein
MAKSKNKIKLIKESKIKKMKINRMRIKFENKIKIMDLKMKLKTN